MEKDVDAIGIAAFGLGGGGMKVVTAIVRGESTSEPDPTFAVNN